MSPSLFSILAAVIFGVAVVHTFSTKWFESLARTRPAHAGIFHLLGEVEVVFGFWALVLMVAMFALEGSEAAKSYIDSRNFTEPMFVFAIMVIAGTRPILALATSLVTFAALRVSAAGSKGMYFILLTLVPLLGSFITEPAAMTLAALLLGDSIFARSASTRFKYATLGVLFVNVSVGGTLTPFAAPPVLMVAERWDWDFAFMMTHFGWKAMLVVTLNALGATMFFSKELRALPLLLSREDAPGVPAVMIWLHLAFLASVVVFAHHPAIFMGLFLFFLGLTHAYPRHQSPLLLREGLLVAFFLAGLVVLGGHQRWWLEPLLLGMNHSTVFAGATLLTAFTDNAALTYLGSLVEGLSHEFKIALVSGAVVGGGLTIIANAPNPAGVTILARHFDDAEINALGLFLGALLPTLCAALVFGF